MTRLALATLMLGVAASSAAETSTSTAGDVVAIELERNHGFFVPSQTFAELDADSEELRIRLRQIDELKFESRQLRIALVATTKTASASIELSERWKKAYQEELSRQVWPVTNSREFWTGLGFVVGIATAIGVFSTAR